MDRDGEDYRANGGVISANENTPIYPYDVFGTARAVAGDRRGPVSKNSPEFTRPC